MFERINLNDLGQRSNNDVDLWYSYVFMFSLSEQLYQLSVHRLQQFLLNIEFKHFFIKSTREKADLVVK